MKRGKEILLAILLGMILPMLLLKTLQSDVKRNELLCVRVLTGDGVRKMDIEEYLVGVLLKEMPADFEFEAVKAQAVAARTYTLYWAHNGSKHADADVCIYANCCQGYISPAEYASEDGSSLTVFKMYEAVEATEGEVLLYDNQIIESTYFSSAGGKTEDALEVWGTAVPYLQSVESVEKDTIVEKEIDNDDFCTALGLENGDIRIGATTYTKGGGIAKVVINGITFTGKDLRQRLGLRSTNVTLSTANEKVLVITNGNGHRVGMSQYGADAMAAEGSDYRQILKHYYSGVTIRPYAADKN